MEYSINLIKDQLSPNLYKAMAINEDKKAIPEKIKMICVLLNPRNDKWCVVWSLPPINGDCFRAILFINTLVVSEIGKMKINKTIIICRLEINSWVSNAVEFQKYLIPTIANKRPINWLPESPIYILAGVQL